MKLDVKYYHDLFTFPGCEWVCVGGSEVGRIAKVIILPVVDLIWKDTGEVISCKDNHIPFVARIGEYETQLPHHETPPY